MEFILSIITAPLYLFGGLVFIAFVWLLFTMPLDTGGILSDYREGLKLDAGAYTIIPKGGETIFENINFNMLEPADDTGYDNCFPRKYRIKAPNTLPIYFGKNETGEIFDKTENVEQLKPEIHTWIDYTVYHMDEHSAVLKKYCRKHKCKHSFYMVGRMVDVRDDDPMRDLGTLERAEYYSSLGTSEGYYCAGFYYKMHQKTQERLARESLPKYQKVSSGYLYKNDRIVGELTSTYLEYRYLSAQAYEKSNSREGDVYARSMYKACLDYFREGKLYNHELVPLVQERLKTLNYNIENGVNSYIAGYGSKLPHCVKTQIFKM